MTGRDKLQSLVDKFARFARTDDDQEQRDLLKTYLPPPGRAYTISAHTETGRTVVLWLGRLPDDAVAADYLDQYRTQFAGARVGDVEELGRITSLGPDERITDVTLSPRTS